MERCPFKHEACVRARHVVGKEAHLVRTIMFEFLLGSRIGEILAPIGPPQHQLHLAIQNKDNDKVVTLCAFLVV
jgi:hypothetical protein